MPPDRKFVRVSLGGVHDEAEIRGHRRTYVGALPGNIIQGMRKAGTNNCVMMLDEVDKLGQRIHGDPAAALLEVLDPEQNATFRDNYLGVPFDLSRVMFICTANMLDSISGPLRDRMEIIQLPGYTEKEKLQIARRYLLPRQLEANGLARNNAKSPTTRCMRSSRAIPAKPGCAASSARSAACCARRRCALRKGQRQRVVIGEQDLEAILGAPRFENEVAMRTSVPGVATGLAWTPVGGDILFIEATRTPGGGKLILTGQLGDVMKESAQAALSLREDARSSTRHRSRAVREERHPYPRAGRRHAQGRPQRRRGDVHRAGVADDSRALPANCAMTGEISLRGLVLPVGGIKEKVLAALRAGITTVLLPARNRKDVEDVPPDARAQLTFVFLETIDDALRSLMPA